MENRFKKVLLIIVIFVFIVPAFILVAINFNNTKEEEVVFCTADAMMCPDGSYVGRVPPSCNFAKCPNAPVNKQEAKIGERILNNGVYITPLAVISDSRCPLGVTCIWAGTVVIKTKLEYDGKTKEFNIELNKETVFGDKKILLNKVLPEKTQNNIEEQNYIFTFQVVEN